MKYLSVTWLAAVAAASPHSLLTARNLAARALAAEACSVGYCTQNGGTTGGSAGQTVTVTTVDALTQAAKQDGPLTIIVSGAISGSAKVRVSADKTIIGEAGSSLTGVGLYIRRVNNVIVRNLKIAKVLAANGDAIGIDASTNVWIDHCDLSGDLSSDKDDLDGLLDISHGADWITVSDSYLHDHWKASLIGHSDSNASEDKGKLHVTYTGNFFQRTSSRAPLVRFGTVHIVNNLWDSLLLNGVNCRMGAQVLIQSSAFRNSPERAVFFADSPETGYAVLEDVDLGGSKNSVPTGTLTSSSLPYSVKTLGSSAIANSIPNTAGQKL
ncbi:polysaccharide lyase family 1 protein [Durotheca rogersii]|uniref:polysaccharide lyase family 1 protein n=1 Tax=Durotheca rogersii TaxID=419775 RepID=UPI00221EBAFD|nr:polysaccharide lyase family 1 protein [Durotheca rogersii]KAI5864109.1 polysaccharide lyase family 1 protein [Durotheca rogersii]